MTNDYLLTINDLDWYPLGDRTWFRLLRHNHDTGQFVIILRMDAGAQFLSHKHYGPAEFLMMKGELDYTDKVARPGDYGWEGMYARHESTKVAVDTEMLFIGYGPIIFEYDAGNTILILDGGLFADVAAGRSGGVSITV